MPISDVLQKELSGKSELERIFQKHVVDGPSHYFSSLKDGVEMEYELRHLVATACDSMLDSIDL